MILTATYLQTLTDCRDKSLAGGKAVNLGVLLRAGFAVPDGFVVTTDAYRHWSAGKSEEIPDDLTQAILKAYRGMGSPSVAVRSSATAEDMSEASMAGQYETYLDIRDEHSLLNRIRCCWASLDSPRTRAYLHQHGIDIHQVAMAVVVQRLVPSDVAGVLFTANPQTGSRHEMLIEASWGLGEAVVSGRVQPDVLRLEGATGRVVHARIADKQIMIPPGGHSHEDVPVDEDRRTIPCLKSADVTALWKLGQKAADHFGRPQDIEWAVHNGNLYLLQSRPITTLEDAETYELLLQSTRAQLRGLLEKGRGPWVVHNLSETLPHPTPLTWSVIERFMSGAGGFGSMYRTSGFDPSPLVCKEGFLTLVAGKIYMDAALCPEMFFEGYPFKYDVEQLRKNPDAAQSPPSIPCGPAVARMKMLRRAMAAGVKIHSLADSYDARLTGEVIPAFVAWVKEQKQTDLRALATADVVTLWHHREHRVMDDFAPQSLLPSLISGAALAELRTFLEECFWDHDPDELTNLLSSGHEADKTVLANAQLYEVAQGEEPAEKWLAEYGHRAPEEFDLATPRWRERPQELLAMARRLRDGASPADIHHAHLKKIEQQLASLREALSESDRAELDRRLSLARRYMRFREDGKFYLMLGYDLLRDLALEIGRRLEIGEDVFFLTREEMIDALHIGFAPHHLIAQRKTHRKAEKRIPLPYVIDEAAIESLGAPANSQLATGNSQLEAFGISPGTSTGPARIVRTPESAGDLGQRYILVCPSTDPSWTPLFTNAAGLILECGGTLSHGAVVAREMSIPAVVLRDACTLLKEGDTITIDGRNGQVTRDDASTDATAATADKNVLIAESLNPSLPSSRPNDNVLPYGQRTIDNGPLTIDRSPSDTRIDRSLTPPPRARIERNAARLRNLFLLGWGLYLLLAFILPDAVLFTPSLSFLDTFLWPLVRVFGKPGAVAIIAAVLAALTMLGQKYLTDNDRLVVAKRRAMLLQKEAAQFPSDSPRARALRALAAPVQTRVVAAAMLPIGLLLGPMVMVFFWLPARVDPASWNAAPGKYVDLVATVKTDRLDSLALDLPQGLTLDSTTPLIQKVPPIRKTLEKLRDTKYKPNDLSNEKWEIREHAEQYRTDLLNNLNDYLKNIPPQPITWRINTPENISDRWPVTVRADYSKSLSAQIVAGDQYPPAPTEIDNTPNDPLVSLKLVYPDSDTKRTFWVHPINFGLFHFEPGWLTVYLLAYLPAMFGLRALLKVA